MAAILEDGEAGSGQVLRHALRLGKGPQAILPAGHHQRGACDPFQIGVAVTADESRLPLPYFRSQPALHPAEPVEQYGIGLAVGILYSLTTISGPPLALWFNNQGLAKSEYGQYLLKIVAEASGGPNA